MHMIYDVEKHINIKKIEEILNTNIDKKVYVFGGGTAGNILMEKILHRYEVVAYLDNNKKLWGSCINGITIKDPKILKLETKGTYIVLILSKHVHDISLELEELSLIKGIDYYDIYNEFLEYFRIKKFDNTTKKFIEFLNNIPDDTFNNITIKENKKIGIVCIAMMIQADAWYPMLQALLLCLNGYDTTLIIDNLKSYDDIIYFNGIQKITEIYVNYVLELLKEKCPILKVEDVRSEGRIDLDATDEKHIQYYGVQVIRWFDSRKDERFLPTDEDRIAKSYQILQRNLKVIKAYFKKHSYDVICLLTGLHRHRNLYTYICQNKGIRVSTYDSEVTNVTLYCASGLASHADDINKVVKENWFTEDEKRKIVKMAKENFKQRRMATYDRKLYSYQPILDQKEITKPYDIIVPLNVLWDAAALARDRIFGSYTEWLQETIDYIMENTDATIMIREHPAQVYLKEYNHEDINKILKIDNYNERVYICRAEEKINTYQYIEQAKLVLPYTSTLGVEAILLNKPIITHTNCYYDDLNFSLRAINRNDYFKKIKEALLKEVVITEGQKSEAYLTYFLQMNAHIKTDVTECYIQWTKRSLHDLSKNESVKEIIDTIAEGIPPVYRNMKKILNEC